MMSFKDFLIKESLENEVVELDESVAKTLYELSLWLEKRDLVLEAEKKKVDTLQKPKQESPEELSKRANGWYERLKSSIYSNRKSTRQGEFKNYKTSNSVILGNMYIFRYDPKHKDKLLFFDETPLTIPFDYKDGTSGLGFVGINLHYVPRQYREAVVEFFINKSKGNSIDKPLNIDYVQHIKNNSRFKFLMWCIRHYLIDHIRGQLYTVPKEDYVNVIHLHSASFTGMSEQAILGYLRDSYESKNKNKTPEVKPDAVPNKPKKTPAPEPEVSALSGGKNKKQIKTLNKTAPEKKTIGTV